MIKLRNLNRTFPPPATTAALADINLQIGRGEFIAIVGPSGGGKSTLLNTIGLLDRPSDGTYTLDGVDVGACTEKELAALRSSTFGFIFQNFHLLDSRPVIDSVELGLLYQAVPPEDRRRTALRALERVGLADQADQIASRLSGGQRQRVAIARALCSDAPVILADEPTGNLDTDNGAQILALLRALSERGKTIVLVTHDRGIAETADRIVQIRDGRVERDQVQRARTAPSPASPEVAGSGRCSSVRISDIARDAAATIGSRAMRSVGLIGAVATAVGLAVTTLGLSGSAAAQVNDRFNAHTNRDVSVSWQINTNADVGPLEPDKVLRDSRQVVGINERAVMLDRGSVQVQATEERAPLQAKIVSASRDIPSAARLDIRWVPNHRGFLRPGDVLIGKSLARQLMLGPLEASPVVQIGGVDANVVGVIKASPREPLLLGGLVSATGQSLGLPPATVGSLLLRTQAGAAQQVAKQIPLAMSPAAPDDLDVSAPTDPTSLRGEIESDVRTTLVAFTAVALLAAVAALANAMVLAVLERRREFGLRKALGARAAHVAALVLAESSIIGVAGGAAGFLAGLVCVLGVTIMRHWIPVFDFSLGPLAVLGGVLAGGVGGTIAALQAVRVQAQDALRG
jgi:macrolide transport system ATP-binding/permease protein